MNSLNKTQKMQNETVSHMQPVGKTKELDSKGNIIKLWTSVWSVQNRRTKYFNATRGKHVAKRQFKVVLMKLQRNKLWSREFT